MIQYDNRTSKPRPEVNCKKRAQACSDALLYLEAFFPRCSDHWTYGCDAVVTAWGAYLTARAYIRLVSSGRTRKGFRELVEPKAVIRLTLKCGQIVR